MYPVFAPDFGMTKLLRYMKVETIKLFCSHFIRVTIIPNGYPLCGTCQKELSFIFHLDFSSWFGRNIGQCKILIELDVQSSYVVLFQNLALCGSIQNFDPLRGSMKKKWADIFHPRTRPCVGENIEICVISKQSDSYLIFYKSYTNSKF